jgi:DNA-directed RNA polymerase subunit RPC12/RpoP
MNERVRRPILHLKLGAAPSPSAAPDATETPAVAPPMPAPSMVWKCRPCGSSFEPPREGPDDEVVRCPSCNARLGKAGDFRLDPPPLEKLRARAAKAPPPPPPAPPPRPRTRTPRAAPVVEVKVAKKIR